MIQKKISKAFNEERQITENENQKTEIRYKAFCRDLAVIKYDVDNTINNNT